jgi:hypothetical protein
MNLYGYKREELLIDNTRPSELAEITLVATPEELRRIAKFIEAAAENMERLGNSYEHEHLSDQMPVFNESPQIIVVSADHPRL